MNGQSGDGSVASAMKLAQEHHHAGRLRAAETIYRQVLATSADHPDALHLLGMIAFQRGSGAEAVELVKRAIGRSPSNPDYHHDLGAVFQRQGRLEEAVACYREALAIRPDFADAQFDLGNALGVLGRLDEAAASYRNVLSFKADDTEAHNNLALVLQRQGKLDEAVDTYVKGLSLTPDSFLLHYNLGNLLRDRGKLDEAAASYNKAILVESTNLFAQHNFAIVLHRQGRIEEAIARYKTAIAIKPDHADAHFNMGRALQAAGRLAEAVVCYRKAVALKPGDADAHNELGSALVAQGRLGQAIECYGHAIALRSDFAEAHSNLGNALHQLRRVDEAMANHYRALELRETPEIRMNTAKCLRELDFVRVDPTLRQLLTRAVSGPWARPVDLGQASIKVIRANPAVDAWIRRAPGEGSVEPDRSAELGAAELEVLQGDTLLHALLENASVCDVGLERLLTAARRALLERADADGRGDADDGGLTFYCALARQCFINEFAFACSDNEFEQASKLREKLAAAVRVRAPFPVVGLVAAAAYFPLASIPGADTLLEGAWPEPVMRLLVQQVAEPLEERRLRASVPAITEIEGRVSREVRQQYEENPYPRWVKANPRLTAVGINEYLRQLFPTAPFRPLGASARVDILVAGCGTGQEPVETAQQILGARLLAVDLSLSSLAYAKRKTQEMGLENIEYAQGDIMGLRALGRTFDVVQSFGVLHHLADPAAGLRELVSLVRPGGLMFLGLYSERARETIVAGRQYIAEKGYGSTPADIRRFRQEVISAEGGSRFRQLTSFSDFYSISECRDLLFHVQEHRFTIPQIKELLDDLGLRFIGFSVKPRVVNEYRARFADDEQRTNLVHWEEFEAAFPQTFMGTYAFWVQRPA
jgi:tetratricopeptide (TPR) repeat protein/SAM-dependent methyltransferase